MHAVVAAVKDMELECLGGRPNEWLDPQREGGEKLLVQGSRHGRNCDH